MASDADVDVLLREIRAGKAAPVYLVHGPERYLADRAVAALVEALLEGAPRDFNLDRFDGKGCDAERLLAAARSFPMMARRRVVLVRDAEQLAPAALAKLSEYAADPAPTTALVLSAEKIDLRKKAVHALRDAAKVVECKKVYARHLPGWITRMAKAEGRRIEPDAVDALVRLVGADLALLESETRKAALLAEEGEPIAARHVRAVVADLREETVFELGDAVAGRAAGDALRILGKMIEGNAEPLHVLWSVGKHLRTLAMADDAVRQGKRAVEALHAMDVREFLVEKYAGQLRRFAPGQLKRAYLAVRDADLALKSSKLPGRLVLEKLVLDLCATTERGRA